MKGTSSPTDTPTRSHLASLVQDWQRWGQQTAVVSYRGNRALRSSYGELASLAGRFATELERRGISPGDRVLLWGENSAEWIAVFFGCLLRGALVVPLDAAGSPEFASRIAAEVAPSLIVGDLLLLRALDSDASRLALSDLPHSLPHVSNLHPHPDITGQTPFQIVFTSGTTSEPKGVVHTHRNVLASLLPIEGEIRRYRRYERPFHPLRFLHTLPLSHVFGQFMGLWIPAVLGAELHLSSALEPARLVSLCKRERISVLVAVPRVLEILRDHVIGRLPWLGAALGASGGIPAWKRWWRFRAVHRLFGLKFWALICGGATLSPELEAFWNGLGFALVQGYGMTETAALVTLNHPFKVGRGTLGKPLPGREVRLGPEGEILVRGDMLAEGIWRHGRLEPRAGEWLATGDLATQDASGELRFTGRKGDVIVSASGLNIHPQDIERVLLAQPGVRAAAVVAYEGPSGPEPAGVVLLDSPLPDLRALQLAANSQLAGFQQLRYLFRWPNPAFPFTTTGKLLRREIAAWVRGQLAQGGTSDVGASSDALLNLIAAITHAPAPKIGDASRLTEDLHLDSLGRVQLQSVLAQRFGPEISDTEMAMVETVGDLRALLSPRSGSLPSAASTEAPAVSAPLAPTLTYARWPWSVPVQWLRSAFLELIAMPLVRVLARPHVIDSGPAPQSGPVLLIANHVNTFDLPILLSALPGTLRRRIAPAMSAEVLVSLRTGQGQGNAVRNLLAPLAYWLLVSLFNVFPLPRATGFRASFAHAGEALDRGYSVLVFPEGSRSYTGALRPFRPGIGLLVQASGVPVLPLALQGMGTGARIGNSWFRGGSIAVHIGLPIVFAPDASPEQITSQLEAELRALNPS